MSETNGQNDSPQPQHTPQKELVGDILHKERVTKRITLETIAKDLKLNVKYIKAIEANDFKNLPADPYVRVYLRSIATYLLLDPTDILKRFFEDRGIPFTDEDDNKSGKIKISVERDNEKRSKSWIIILIVVAVLAVLSYVSNKKLGWLTKTNSKNTTPVVADTTKQDETEQPDTSEELYADSMILEGPLDSIEKSEYESFPSKDSMKLVIKATFDSVWVQIFKDGKSWKNFVRSGTPRVFYAQDSINLHVGNNSRLKYILNGRKLRLPGGSVKIFKIDNEGVEVWTMRKWKTVFGNRL